MELSTIKKKEKGTKEKLILKLDNTERDCYKTTIICNQPKPYNS